MRDAIEEEKVDDCEESKEYFEYYKHIRDNLPKALKIISWNCNQSSDDLDVNDFKKSILIPGANVALADKNYGIVMLPIGAAIKAETDMLKELKAQEIDIGPKQVITTVEKMSESIQQILQN